MNILKPSFQLIYGKKILPIPSPQKLSSSLCSKHSPQPPKAAMDSGCSHIKSSAHHASDYIPCRQHPKLLT